MANGAGEVTAAMNCAIRRIFRCLEQNDRGIASTEIDALLQARVLPESPSNLLKALRAFGDGDHAAEETFTRLAIQLDPDNANAHYWLAIIQDRGKLVPEAAGSLQRALTLDPRMAEAWATYGSMARLGENYDLALHCFLTAIACDVGENRHWMSLKELLSRIELGDNLDQARTLLMAALERPQIDYSSVLPLVYLILSESQAIKRFSAMATAATLHDEIQSGRALGLLTDSFLVLILRRTTLHHAHYEILLTVLRHALLKAIAYRRITPGHFADVTRFTSALAIYALTTEFVFQVTEEEIGLVSTCRTRLREMDGDDAELALVAAIIGCYEPLVADQHAGCFPILASAANQQVEFREMCRLHILEPLMIRYHQTTGQIATPVHNPVSKAVKQQYEENPYPRWRFVGSEFPTTFDAGIRLALPGLRDVPAIFIQDRAEIPLNILVAGCGTGRSALWCATQYLNAQVFAVDLSAASLAYASMKAEELGVVNVVFRQGDILELPSLGRRFDMIDAVGVLHHMEDPAAGLGALSHCLVTGGWIKVALYSRLARWAVREARQRIAAGGVPATATGIRGFRYTILGNPNDPLHAPCTNWRDFFSLSECRDLLFHVQEHQFTTDGLAELIRSAGLEFMGFEADTGLAASATPPVTDFRSLAQWGAFEAAHPDFFGSMYVMWLRKPPH